MRKLSELGISPAPWKCATNDCGEFVGILNGRGFYVAKFAYDVKPQDARLKAAAPLLYDALYDAVKERCRACDNHREGLLCVKFGTCPVHKWRDALAASCEEGGSKINAKCVACPVKTNCSGCPRGEYCDESNCPKMQGGAK